MLALLITPRKAASSFARDLGRGVIRKGTPERPELSGSEIPHEAALVWGYANTPSGARESKEVSRMQHAHYTIKPR
jgi:hypothetical protein